MEQLPSETSSEYVAEIEHSLNWHAAILAVLLQEAGGVVEVKAEDLEKIKLSEAKASVVYNEDRNVYIIEGLYTEDDA
jgi:hypothetical protein